MDYDVSVILFQIKIDLTSSKKKVVKITFTGFHMKYISTFSVRIQTSDISLSMYQHGSNI